MFCWSFWVDPGFREELSTISWELQVLGTCEKVSKKLFTSFKLLQFRGISWGCLLHLCLRVGEIDDTGCCVSVSVRYQGLPWLISSWDTWKPTALGLWESQGLSLVQAQGAVHRSSGTAGWAVELASPGTREITAPRLGFVTAGV